MSALDDWFGSGLASVAKSGGTPTASAQLLVADGPESRPFGLSYRQWSAVWWQWAHAISAAINPLRDTTGQRISLGDIGPVWFLAGVAGESGTATRSGTIRAGHGVFFPILNAQIDNVDCEGGPDLNFSVAELREQVDEIVDATDNLSLQVNGQSLDNLEDFRFRSPVFGFGVPTGSLYRATGCDVDEPRLVFPAVADGYYVMLRPLSVGQHTVHFTGTFTDFGFTLDVTYNLTVVP